ncbi:melatonin receptor type 1B-A-like [Mytilus trossulus]|uniref:melatonin receptor type 1B-A-like n=1 Tax=Mytilus trossulus TaxID=6551 RepID=UPI00300714F6
MNLTDSSPSELIFGRYGFVDESPAVAIPILMILVFASLIGTFGNILILITIITTKNLQRLECIFMANLAFSDMYVTLLADPLSIVAKLEGEEFFDKLPGFCRTVASGCTIACINSLGSITLLSFNRYVFICHHKYYFQIFHKKTCIIMCCCLYCVGLSLVLLNFAGIGDHSFDRKSLECIWDRLDTYPYTVIFSVALVWIPVIIVGFSYLGIFLSVHKSRQNIKHSSSMRKTSYSSGLARTLFIIYAVFTTCWIPYALIIVLDRYNTFPHEVHIYITVWAHLHPSFNWLVYYFTNTKFQAAFDRIAHLDKIFGRCRSGQSNEELSTSGELQKADTSKQHHESSELSDITK